MNSAEHRASEENSMEATEQQSWLTVPDVARELQIPRTRAYTLISEGSLPAVRIGQKSIRVNRRELETFLLEQRRVVSSGEEDTM
jgi:excisionase family DNA binding protein